MILIELVLEWVKTIILKCFFKKIVEQKEVTRHVSQDLKISFDSYDKEDLSFLKSTTVYTFLNICVKKLEHNKKYTKKQHMYSKKF